LAEQSQLNAQWRALITEVLQLPPDYVRPANQNAPAGGLEDKFITVSIGNVVGHGGIQKRTDITDSPDLLFTMTAQRTATATIQAFGAGSFDLLLNLNAMLEDEWATWLFQQRNIGFVARRGPNDLTEIVPAQFWQRRASLAVDFNFIITTQIRVPAFSSFDLSVYLDQDGEIHYEWQQGQPIKCPVGGRKTTTWQSQFRQ
jgi:hypothetical protein